MKKRELEERVFKMAEPLLENLYGKFSVDTDQTDRPDTAITVYMPHERFDSKAGAFRVGIEITTVDKEQDLAYLNDEKYEKDKVIAQTMDVLSNSLESAKPIKKANIEITASYIYDGVIRKKEKYQGYFESGTYREIILLCFSDFLTTDTLFFKEDLQGRTDHLLRKAQFPFDAVMFVNLRHGTPVWVYRKNDPLLGHPASTNYSGSTVEVVYCPTMLVGKTYNLQETMSKAPLIPPR